MTLPEEALDRLADVVELQPTKNAELMQRWGMDSGSEVHGYLESELKEYYFRDENSLIRATEDAADLVGVEPGVSVNEDGTPDRVTVSELAARAFDVLPGPDEESQSIVATLQDLRAEYDVDPTTDEVREALNALKRKGVVEVVRRAVPTYRRAVERGAVTVTVTD